jgi:hypothetical protein
VTYTYVTTATGRMAHIGTARAGQVQTLCGIGYGRYARGRALAASGPAAIALLRAKTCKRCAAMDDGAINEETG